LLQVLKALADANRLKILRLLVDADLCVGALAAHLGISKPAISQHLQVLRKAGLVEGQKRGYWTHYRVNRQVLSQIAGGLDALATGDGHQRTACRCILPQLVPLQQVNETDMGRNCRQQPVRIQEKPEDSRLDGRCRHHGDPGPAPRHYGEPPDADRSLRSD